MRRIRDSLLCAVGVIIATVVILFPFAMLFFSDSERTSAAAMPIPSGNIILKTIWWSLLVGLISTTIGWAIGVRLASVQKSIRVGIVAMLLMSLAIPAYAVFYAWWQAWPSGTWMHGYLVEHAMLGDATKLCLLFAFVGWSWPIPALIAMMTAKSSVQISLLHQIDGAPLFMRLKHRFVIDFGVIFSSVVLVSSITAANTTCFDLAQVSTIGNEIRAAVATGAAFSGTPLLSIGGLGIAAIATTAMLRISPRHSFVPINQDRSCAAILIVWLLLTGGPMFISAIVSLGGGGFQLWKFYAGDMIVSASIGISVAVSCIVILVISMSMHLSLSRRIRILAKGLDCCWIFVALLPAGILSAAITNAWNQNGLDAIYRSTLILIIAQLAHIGFVGSLAGKWIASSKDVRTLCTIDGITSLRQLLVALRPRIISSTIVVVGVAIAMSIGEVAITSQLSPPAVNQPIAVSLLNAMHYQRPEIVTSTLCLIVLTALIGGLLIYVTHRKLLCGFAVLVLLGGCDIKEHESVDSNAIIIGGAGLVDGRFITPRAIDANEHAIVVIDKSGRLQLFTFDGDHQASWDLPLSGMGYPTGVSFDQLGYIWVADTHGHRVLVYDIHGNEWLRFGSYGTDEGEFLYPTDIAFGKSGEVYVSEYGGNDRINVFDRSGKFIRSFGHHGEGPTGFMRPQSIAIEPKTGNLMIVDSGNHRVAVCDTSGNVLRLLSAAGREEGEMLYPYGITFVSPDLFVICEYGNNRLQYFSSSGEHIASVGNAGDRAGQFKTPWGVAKTPTGIIVADTGNNRLQLLPDMITNQ
ncbi:MAG: 6-bladed beta-propeller [Planctomycetota bacterium]|nr:6-bladed beta-propeller [Planctomycetota bacterium]